MKKTARRLDIESTSPTAIATILPTAVATTLLPTLPVAASEGGAVGIGLTVAGWLAALAVGATAVAARRRERAGGERLRSLEARVEEKVRLRTDELEAAIRKLEADVGERRMATEALRMLERAVEQSIDGIAVLDMAGSTQFVNEAWARMHGYEVPEVLGHHLSLFHTPDQMEEQIEPFLKKVRQHGAHEAEAWHRRKDGGVFPTRMSFTLLRDGDGSDVGFVGITRDITESRKAAEEQVRLEAKVQHNEKLKSLGVLAGGIAHDFNNLLTGVLGNAGLLHRELAGSAELVERVRQIEASAERAAELTDQLLAYAGEDQLIVRPLQLNDIAEGLVMTLEKIVPEQAELRIDLNKYLPRIEANAGQLRQILTALVTNAGESLDDRRGWIEIATELRDIGRDELSSGVLDVALPPGPYVVLRVRDNGCGMDDETRTRMFDPFFSTKFTGRGLGLAATLGIVRGHGGTIRVRSKPGGGTSLEILFPALEETGAEMTIEDTSETFEGWTAQGTILVVDNEKIMRVVAKSILERHGFDVITANDGLEAVEIFAKERLRIRLVLLDLTMPEMDGVQAFREIRKIDPEALVILMTGYKEQEVRPGFAGRGLAGFIQKPFRPEELIRVVRGVVEG